MLMNLYTQRAPGPLGEFKNHGIHTYSVVGMIATPEDYPEGQFIHVDCPEHRVMLDRNVDVEFRGQGLAAIATTAQWHFKEAKPPNTIGLVEAFGIMGVNI